MKGLLFTYLATYGGALVSLVNPFIGLLIYVSFAIIRPHALWYWSVPADGNYSRIVAIGLLLGWLFTGFGKWQFGSARLVVMALLGYFFWSALGAPLAVADTSKAWMQVEEYAKVVLPFLVGITTIRTTRQVKQLAWVIALSQGYLAYEFNLTYYFNPMFDPNEWTFGGLDRNGLAITMVASAGFTFFLALYSPKLWQKLLGFALAALMVHVILFSLSRGGMLALIVTGAMTFLLIPKRPVYLLIALLGLAIGFRMAGPHVMERFATVMESEDKRDASAQSRVQLWTACFNLMLKHPVTGIGSNNWRLVAHHHGFPEGKDAHSTWMHVGAELGILGLGMLLTFYGACAYRLWRLRRNPPAHLDPWLPHCADAVIVGLAGYAVSAQFVSMFGVELPFYLNLVGAGVLKLYSTSAEAYSPEATPVVASQA